MLVAAAAFVLRFPLATALVMFGLTDFIFYATFFSYPLGSVSVRPHEVALAALLLLAAVRPVRRTWGGTAGAALAAFLALVTVSALLAIYAGRTTSSEALSWARPFAMLAFFWVIVRLFPTPEQRRTLLTGVAAIAAGTGVVALVVALGAGFGHSLEAPGGETIRAQGSIERVRLAGLSAGYALFWFAVVQMVAGRGARRLAWALILGGIVLDIVVSFNRNMWIGLAIGLILMAVLGGARLRNRLLAAVAVGIAGMAMLGIFGASTNSNSSVVGPVIKRGETLLHLRKTEQESSLADRFRETRAAWKVAEDHLAIGVGAGAPFGVFSTEQVGSGEFVTGFRRSPQLFLHNQYLYLLLIAGIPGLLAFLLFLGTPVRYAFGRRPRDPAVAACGVGIALIMISSVVAIYFSVEDMTAVLGLLAGVVVADAEGRGAEGRRSGLVA
ncbi:MAG TPA: O-antigen ligase family protein [Gemmatimonadales bacterium]|nr:O-antigen ligase family protein [Gemmatimonadales bacterium]